MKLRRTTHSRIRTAAVGALLLATALSLPGCSKAMRDVTGSIGAFGAPGPIPTDEDALRRYADDLGQRYDRNPKDKATAMAYAKALSKLNQHNQAVAVMQSLAIQNPEDMKVLGAYGKALADAGDLQKANEILSKAHTPERPDWSVLSTQGSIADQLGQHEQARAYYDEALKIKPNDPMVLSNLGLSYALSKQLPRAEETLVKAAAHPEADTRVRQNLALVLALQGKFKDAEELSRRDLSPADAAANVASIREMIAQNNTWRDLQTDPVQAGKPRPNASR